MSLKSERITKRHLERVCKLGTGETCCAFLVFGGGFTCAKGTEIEPTIRRRLAEGSMNAKGDNCNGWKEQR